MSGTQTAVIKRKNNGGEKITVQPVKPRRRVKRRQQQYRTSKGNIIRICGKARIRKHTVLRGRRLFGNEL